jgi:hypothetical protein
MNYDGEKKIKVCEPWENCTPPKAISQMLDKMIPIDQAKKIQEERKRQRRIEELNRVDSWLNDLRKRRPGKFWLLAAGVAAVALLCFALLLVLIGR